MSAVIAGARRLVVLLLRRRGATAVLVAGDPDAALLGSAAALRRLGARITRYDSESGTLEAALTSGEGTMRLRACARGDDATLVELEGDRAARGVVRRFRGALSA